MLGIPAIAAGVRICTEPLDVSGTTRVPAEIDLVKSRDDVAYSAHGILGTLLERLGCQPAATAVQWLKAAAHARTEAELERAARGIFAARQRSQSASQLEVDFCSAVAQGIAGPRQATALAEAGFHCAP
jgi:hypothetical protein